MSCRHRKARERGISVILVFGWDAAGKGGAIRRVTAALDAASIRLFRSLRRPMKSALTTICGASGGTFLAPAR